MTFHTQSKNRNEIKRDIGLTGKECPGECAHCRSPRQKKMLDKCFITQDHFSCPENVQMSNCLTLTWDATSRNGQRQAWWPKCAATASPREIRSPDKIAFWRFLLSKCRHLDLVASKTLSSIKKNVSFENTTVLVDVWIKRTEKWKRLDLTSLRCVRYLLHVTVGNFQKEIRQTVWFDRWSWIIWELEGPWENPTRLDSTALLKEK